MQGKFKPTIIILSAGNGERMQSSIPKVLHEVSLKPIIEYVINLAAVINSDSLNIVINEELQNNQTFKDFAIKYKLKIILQKERLGTGDAVKIAFNNITAINDLVLILYGDTPFVTENTIMNMYNEIDRGADLCVVGFDANNPDGYGRVVSKDNNRVVEIIEDKDANNQQKQIKLCNSGIILAKKHILEGFLSKSNKLDYDFQKEFYLTDIVKYTVLRGKICTYILADESEVMGINDRVQLINAEYYNQKLIVKRLLSNGVTVINPQSSYFANNIKVKNDVIIYPNVFIGKDTVINSGSIINSFSHIEGVTVDKGVIIGPFARIRPNTKIGSNSKIGNFVEIKNSTLMNNIKAGHLSYIGDATIYDDVNIGAGTVFCNYDGENKHHSVIGEKVFIGSNTSIISPVKVDSKSMIAAGSVITKNIDKYDLAIARSKQVNLKNKSKVK